MTTYYEIKNIVAVLALGSCQEFVCLNGIVFRMLYWPQEFIKVRYLLKIRPVRAILRILALAKNVVCL